MIRTKNIKKVYANREVETVALDGINLEINEGEFVCLMGPSGSGKTSLVKILGLLSPPTAGQYYFMDHDVSRSSSRDLTGLRRGRIGFVSRQFDLVDELTVSENVELPLLYLKIPARERKEKVREALERNNIGHKRDHYPQQLSGGQQQRASIARAAVIEPLVIIADEPTGNMDSVNGDETMRLLTRLNDEGVAIILATHSPGIANYAHRTVSLFDGKIIAENNLNEQFHL